MGSESTLKNRSYPLIGKDFSREESGAIFKPKSKEFKGGWVHIRMSYICSPFIIRNYFRFQNTQHLYGGAMNTTISGRHVDISDAFRENIENHFSTFNDKYQIDPLETNVIVSKEAHLFRSDINSHLGRGVHIRCHGHGGDAYTSFSEALEKLSAQLRKHKKRLVAHHKHQDNHSVQEFPYYVLNSNTPEEVVEENPAIIAELKKDIPTLSVGDAVMRMDLGDEPVYAFRNSKNDKVNFIYKRKDGNIGWIDPPE